MSINCFHCGDSCKNTSIAKDNKYFCCFGCKTVYEIISENDLTCYYDLETTPGNSPKDIAGKYDYLTQTNIVEKLVEFNDGLIEIVTLYIPSIHCSSCIWILENLNKLNPHISSSQINFGKKNVRIIYDCKNTNLKAIVLLLSSLGYEPYISLEDLNAKPIKPNHSLIYKLAIAGFAFGNVMFLSFPEYFEVGEFWLEKYKTLFRWLMFAFSIPVVCYAAQDYYISAYKGIKKGLLNIDVPIALGVIVLFLRSTVDIAFDLGSGFFDSLTGLIFFLLLGKFFQQKTYEFLSFERDYKSYFPIAITKIKNGLETQIPVYDIKKGDKLLIRNNELIPTDGLLLNGNAQIDYSFVTGESKLIKKNIGEKLFAGGKQTSGCIEVEVLNTVEQSYLTQLWGHDVFNKNKEEHFKTLTNNISKRFTIAILSIAFLSTLFWLIVDASKAINVFTSVLIIACPCAIALAAPFTLGNLIRIFGKEKCYLKNTSVIEQLAAITTVVFDKTGTITSNNTSTITYQGNPLDPSEKILLKNALRGSNHPLSRAIYDVIEAQSIIALTTFEEHLSEGIYATLNEKTIKIGSAKFVGILPENELKTVVYISINNTFKGKYVFNNSYRKDIENLFKKLDAQYKLVVLSGDNAGEKEHLEQLLPKHTTLIFDKKPEAKLTYIKHLQSQGEKVLMVGDGLNDAGALAQSNVGIVISENINVFSPACDAILEASKFNQIHHILNISKQAIGIIKLSFVLSFFYNCIGLYFAITGQLSPVIAAILMPLSSISIVTFTTLATSVITKKMN